MLTARLAGVALLPVSLRDLVQPEGVSRVFRLSRSRSRGGIGGAGRDRTDDPLLAKQVLSQLSYSPFQRSGSVNED